MNTKTLNIIIFCVTTLCTFKSFSRNEEHNHFSIDFILKKASIDHKFKFGVSITDYGAVPVSTWQEAKDSYAAIQKAINENPGKQINIPAGLYVISRPLIINKAVRIMGENKHSTFIKSLNGGVIIINDGGTSIENLYIYGDSGIGLTISNVRNTTLSNIFFQNTDVGIKLINAWNTKIDNIDVTINPNQNPKISKSIILEGQCVNNTITNSHLTATDIGIEIKINKNKSEGLMLNNVVISSAKIGLKSEGILSLHLVNCIIDLCLNYGLDINNTAGLLATNNWIVSNGSNNGAAIRLSSSWDSHFSNNNIKCAKGNSVITIENESNRNLFYNNTIELVDENKPIVHLDKTTSNNSIESNNFKSPKDVQLRIKNESLENKVLNNLGVN